MNYLKKVSYIVGSCDILGAGYNLASAKAGIQVDNLDSVYASVHLTLLCGTALAAAIMIRECWKEEKKFLKQQEKVQQLITQMDGAIAGLDKILATHNNHW